MTRNSTMLLCRCEFNVQHRTILPAYDLITKLIFSSTFISKSVVIVRNFASSTVASHLLDGFKRQPEKIYSSIPKITFQSNFFQTASSSLLSGTSLHIFASCSESILKRRSFIRCNFQRSEVQSFGRLRCFYGTGLLRTSYF